jgi:2,4-diketo-3-deoxy-L-fuconate hydrolase
VTADDLGAEVDDLDITCTVNGELMQQGSTRDLIFPVNELVSCLSHVTTLLPGDVIFTGTPAGVGSGRTPPKFLRDGDVVESTISGIGTLRQFCSAAT